ncbi:MAG: ABC transporter permease [Acidilobus sp.]
MRLSPTSALFLSFAILLSTILIIFFVYPLVILLLIGGTGIPSALRVPSFALALLVTIITSSVAALVSVLLGTPLAYLLARFDFRLKGLVEAIVDIPIAVPHIIVGVMIVLAFAQYFGLGGLLRRLHIDVIDTLVGASMAVTYVSATYAVRVIESALLALDPDVELVAMTLGASRLRTFLSVVLPRIKRAIATGALTAWARAASEAGALLIVAFQVYLGRSLIYPAPVAIYEAYVGLGILDAAQFSAAMLIVVLAVFLVARFIMQRGRPSA